jgi:cellulose synthase/poly-beta-1,6-N-acetylglucosamine synthase-like glycosyltransferase
MQISKNAFNASISCGSGVIYRRKAIEEIGGFCEWSLVEDLHSSMLLEDKGWHSVYYPFALTEGTAPSDIFAQQQQRRQWATDSVRILFWDNPFFRKGALRILPGRLENETGSGAKVMYGETRNGIQMRMMEFTDINTGKTKWRWDVFFGVNLPAPDQAGCIMFSQT